MKDQYFSCNHNITKSRLIEQAVHNRLIRESDSKLINRFSGCFSSRIVRTIQSTYLYSSTQRRCIILTCIPIESKHDNISPDSITKRINLTQISERAITSIDTLARNQSSLPPSFPPLPLPSSRRSQLLSINDKSSGISVSLK